MPASALGSIRERVGLAESDRDFLCLGYARLVFGSAQNQIYGFGDLLHVGLVHAAARHGGGSEAYAAGLEGRARLSGNRILVGRDIGLVERVLCVLSGEVRMALAQVEQYQMVVGAARYQPVAALFERIGEPPHF